MLKYLNGNQNNFNKKLELILNKRKLVQKNKLDVVKPIIENIKKTKLHSDMNRLLLKLGDLLINFESQFGQTIIGLNFLNFIDKHLIRTNSLPHFKHKSLLKTIIPLWSITPL